MEIVTLQVHPRLVGPGTREGRPRAALLSLAVQYNHAGLSGMP